MSLIKKNIVIVTHKFVTHPDDALVEYLNKHHYANVLHICHSFYDADNRKSYYKWYKNGKLHKSKESLDYHFLPEVLLYLKEMFFTFVWIINSKIYWNKYIGMDGLCVLVGNISKIFKKVDQTIYWAIDFVPQNRFSARWKNKIYHSINIHGYKNSDEMWDLSPRMFEARQTYLGLVKKDYKKLKVVPYGMYTDRIKKYSYLNCNKKTIVFMGHIKKSQGIQLIIRALPLLLKYDNKIIFKIIGTGPYIENLKLLTKKLNIDKNCIFMGKIQDHRELEQEIAKSSIAVAPYIKKLDKWTYYADPGKVKTYLACGVPVLLTNLPWNSEDIQANKCGIIISENQDNIIKNIKKLMNKNTNIIYRKNAVIYSKKFDYKNIFKEQNL